MPGYGSFKKKAKLSSKPASELDRTNESINDENQQIGVLSDYSNEDESNEQNPQSLHHSILTGGNSNQIDRSQFEAEN
jgi:hypothetical protein